MHMCTRTTHTQPEIRVVLALVVRSGVNQSACFQPTELPSGDAAAAAVRVADWSTNKGCYREEKKPIGSSVRWMSECQRDFFILGEKKNVVGMLNFFFKITAIFLHFERQEARHCSNNNAEETRHKTISEKTIQHFTLFFSLF